jgi:hypothetical protein
MDNRRSDSELMKTTTQNIPERLSKITNKFQIRWCPAGYIPNVLSCALSKNIGPLPIFCILKYIL